ncbi:Calcium permeable stress-gated cation channel 1 [Dictyocoela muelleri]|nr:Calcium permeable stress-gated cation channel 1 [Dictyocoela muelleri]
MLPEDEVNIIETVRDNPSLSESDSAIINNASIQLSILLIGFIVYFIIRNRLQWIYKPNVLKSHKHPAFGYDGYFNWLIPIFKISDHELLTIIGLDSFVMLNCLKMLCRVFIILSVVVTPVLSYLYFTDNNGDENHGQYFLRLSICNVGNGSSKLWVPVFMVFLATFLFLYLIFIQSKKMIALRQAYIRNPSIMTDIITLKKKSFNFTNIDETIEYINMPSKTVLLKNLPPFIENNIELRKFMDSLGAGKVVDCVLIRDTRKLNSLIQKRKSYLLKIEKELNTMFIAMENYFNKNKKMCQEKIKNLDEFIHRHGQKNVALVLEIIQKENKFLRKNGQKLREYNEKLKIKCDEIHEEKCSLNVENNEEKDILRLMNEEDNMYGQNIENSTDFLSMRELLHIHKNINFFSLDLPIGTKTAFVTFEHQRSASIMCQALIGSKIFGCDAVPAPAPNDVIWDHVNRGPVEGYIKHILGNLVYLVFIIGFYFVAFLLISLLKIKQLAETFHFLGPFIADHKELIKQIDGTLGPLLYSVLLSLSPLILSILVDFEGVISHSSRSRRLMEKYGYFQLYIGFLSFLVFTSLYDTVRKFFTDDSNFILKLAQDFGSSLIDSGAFFFNAILTNLCLTNLIFLLKIPVFINRNIKLLFSGKMTAREKRDYKMPSPMDFGILYPTILLILPMSLTYSIITPLIIILGASYFIFTYLLFKSEFIYALRNVHESGGSHWSFFTNYVLNSLIICQTASICQLFVKEAKTQALILFILLLLTVYYKRHVLKLFKKSTSFYPLNIQEAHYIDAFTKTVFKFRKEVIENWDETLDKYEDDHITLKELGYELDGEEKKYPYRDPSMGGASCTLFLPKGFFGTLENLKKNDRENIFDLK